MATRIMQKFPWLMWQIARRRDNWKAKKKPEVPPSRSPRRANGDDRSTASTKSLYSRPKVEPKQNQNPDVAEHHLGSAENPLKTPSLAPPTSESAESCRSPQIPDHLLLRVSVYSECGQRAFLALPPDLMGHRLKVECMYLFGEIGADLLWYRLMVLDATGETLGREVADGQTLREAALQNHDEIFLMRPVVFVETEVQPFKRELARNIHFTTGSRDPINQKLLKFKLPSNYADPNEPFPDATDINRATGHLQRNNRTKNSGHSTTVVNIEQLVLHTDIQFNIRQILISLSMSSACVIGLGANARRLIDMFQAKLAATMPGLEAEGGNWDAVLQHLANMGFESGASIAALEQSEGDSKQALRSLIEMPVKAETASASNPEANCNAITNISLIPDRDSQPRPKSYRNVEVLQTIIRVYSRKTIPLPDDMVRTICEMGFEETVVIEALKIAKNNYVAACDWLHRNVEERRERGATTNADDGQNRLAEIGLPADSPLLMALLSSTTVQASLAKPKMLIAYLAILDDYSAMNVWLAYGETAACLGHILRTYHEHKHLQAINHDARKQAISNATV